MTTENCLLIDITNGIATLTLDRPKVSNAFDPNLIAQLHAALLDIETNDNVRVIVLTASGKHFSAGADINWMRSMASYSQTENIEDSKKLANLLHTLNQIKKPTIAVVKGAAYGGAIGLIACCDIAIASPESKFCFSEVKIGLIPAVISPYVIAAIGNKHARRYFITAEVFNAETALQLNLIQIVSEELTTTTQKLAQQILLNGPNAVIAAKQLIFENQFSRCEQSLLNYTAEAIANIRVSDEGQEGLSAFIEKRKPSWITE